MPKGFVMVDVNPGTEQSVEDAIRKIGGIQFAYQVTGEHDIVAFMDTEPYANFAHLVATIRQVPGVKDTDTLLVLDS